MILQHVKLYYIIPALGTGRRPCCQLAVGGASGCRTRFVQTKKADKHKSGKDKGGPGKGDYTHTIMCYFVYTYH